MPSGRNLAAESDLLQAIEFNAFLGAERRHLADQLSRHSAALTTATTTSTGDPAGLRRTIRQLENDLRQVDRMLEAIHARFPGAV